MRFLQSASFKSVATLVTGASLAQLIPLLASPLLTRLFTPAEFGMFGLFTSLAIVLTGMIGGQYERASVLPKGNAASLTLLNLSFMVALVLAIVFSALAAFFGQGLSALLGKPEIEAWLWLVPVAAFASFGQRAGVCYSNRHYRYKRISVGHVMQAGLTVAVQIVGGFFGLGLTALVVGFASGKAAAAAYLLKAQNAVVFDSRYLTSKRRQIACMAKRYKKFPSVSATSILLDNLSLQAAVIISVTAYSFDQVGQFVLAQRMLAVPLGVVAIAVGEVFFRKIVDAVRAEERIPTILASYAKWLFLAILPAPLLLVFYGPEIFSAVFGAEWQQAGEFSSILIVAYTSRFVISPLTMIFSATAILAPQAIFRVVYFVLSFGVLGVASRQVSFMEFIYLVAMLEIFKYAVYLVLALRVARQVDSPAVSGSG